METIQRQKIVSVLVVIAVKALISMLHVNSIGPCGRGSGPCIPAEQWSRHVRAQDFPGSSPSASPSPLTVAHLVTADLFDSLFPARNFSFYTYVSFLTAAEAFPDFGTSGGLDSRKQEIAAFVAHIQYETSGDLHDIHVMSIRLVSLKIVPVLAICPMKYAENCFSSPAIDLFVTMCVTYLSKS